MLVIICYMLKLYKCPCDRLQLNLNVSNQIISKFVQFKIVFVSQYGPFYIINLQNEDAKMLLDT